MALVDGSDMRTHHGAPRLWASLTLPLTLGAVACEHDTAPPETHGSAIASIEGSIEAAVDAPWRLEPLGGGGPGDFSDLYPPIPLVVSVHDVAQQEDPEVAIDVGRFCGISVKERTNGTLEQLPPDDTHDTTFQFLDYAIFIRATDPQVREIEVSGPWPPTTAGAIAASLCRQWAGDDCTLQRDPSPTVEWHATIMYTPQQYNPNAWFPYRNGDDVELEVTAIFARGSAECPRLIEHYRAPRADRLSTDARGMVSVGETLRIHLGERPLPRFDARWAYGDLHYHAQGTDNEGESAYAHRPVLQAMRAMGLDFAFATDHASDSADGQVTDADEIFIDNVTLPGPHILEEIAEDLLDTLDAGIPLPTNVSAARDLHDTRFRFLVEHLNEPLIGANAEVLRVAPGPAFAPQLFQGGEVDVVPEVSAEEARRGRLIYGYDFEYRFADACNDIPPLVAALPNWTTYEICATGIVDATFDPNRFTVNDIQIITDQYHARQHMLHLPTSARSDGFVSGRTSLYGGATRALSEVLQREYTEAEKGVAFLAHPADAPFGRHLGRLGPDIVPYAQVQLETAFGAEDMLGLQLWNEDARRIPDRSGPYLQLLLGAQAWDRMLLWGLQDSRTRGLTWLPPGQPRRVFMAGGSDAHGDLNYRRLGRRQGTEGQEDTALGKPRNLVFVGDRQRTVTAGDVHVAAVSQEQVTSALRSGNFSITDGAALRIVVDTNGNGRIDDTDVPMGGVVELTSSRLPLIVEWISTEEFRGVEDIAIYLGVSDGERTLLYGSPQHGVHPPGFGAPVPDKTFRDTLGVDHTLLVGGYMLDTTGALFIRVPLAEGMRGQRSVVLDLANFPVGTLHEQPGAPGACKPNRLCERSGDDEQCGLMCEPDEPPTLTFRAPSEPLRADARAFARGHAVQEVGCTREACVRRLAYTNPVWAMRSVAVDVPSDPIPSGTSPGTVELGARCGTTADCVCSAYCAESTALSRFPVRTCAPRLREGACTDSSECVATAYCARAQCVPRPQLGEACAANVPCGPSLSCDGGFCSWAVDPRPTCH